MNTTYNIALVTGGWSGEAVISRKSAETIKQNINTQLFTVYEIDISHEGWFYINTETGYKTAINKHNFSCTNEKGLVVTFDAALMCIHGTPGEDGKLQGYFDMLQIPYTSCDTTVSAITFNKKFTCAVASSLGIHTAKSMLVKQDAAYNEAEILNSLQLPIFVKPNNGGSSIGMSKVNEAHQLKAALEKAFAEDTQLIIEEFISGREFTIGVFKHQGIINALPITEVITQKEFFDYEAKYLGKSEEITPAQISTSMQYKIEQAAKHLYEFLGCSGVVRIDFIYSDKHQKPYMLEINTVPGQSDASIIPQQVKAMGWTLEAFYTALIQEALHKKIKN